MLSEIQYLRISMQYAGSGGSLSTAEILVAVTILSNAERAQEK